MEEIRYQTNKTLKDLVLSLIRVSSPRARQITSEVSAYFDGIFSKIFNVLPDSSPNEIGYIQSGGFPSVIINGVEFPYIELSALTRKSLARSGLHYKDHWQYKFWHSPNGQFDFLRKARRLVGDSMIEPVAMVINDRNMPAGYIMKKAKGRTLGELMNSKSLSFSDAVKLEQLLSSKVKELHSNGIGHGDLNKGNIFLRPDLEMDIIDPLETIPMESAMEFDRAWVSYIKAELENYRHSIKT